MRVYAHVFVCIFVLVFMCVYCLPTICFSVAGNAVIEKCILNRIKMSCVESFRSKNTHKLLQMNDQSNNFVFCVVMFFLLITVFFSFTYFCNVYGCTHSEIKPVVLDAIAFDKGNKTIILE